MPANNADWVQVFQVQVAGSPGAPVNITGYSLLMQVRASPTASPVLTLTNASGISLIDPTNGKFQVTVPYNAMRGVDPGTYQFDVLQVVSASSRLYLFGGSITVTAGVTR